MKESQGWHSGESNRLPPKWPTFDSLIRRHMWAELLGSLSCFERFLLWVKNQHFAHTAPHKLKAFNCKPCIMGV